MNTLKQVLFIDLQNVRSALDHLYGRYHKIYVFHDNQSDAAVERNATRLLMHSQVPPEYIRFHANQQSQYADHLITSWVGRADQHFTRGLEFVIISNDRGFDAIAQRLSTQWQRPIWRSSLLPETIGMDTTTLPGSNNQASDLSTQIVATSAAVVAAGLALAAVFWRKR